MVWIDSEGSPWQAFALSPREGLAMLALDTGAVYDALAAAVRAFDDPGLQIDLQAKWGKRTPSALVEAKERHAGQRLHRERLAQAGIPLPTNAFASALEALRACGSFSAWLEERNC